MRWVILVGLLLTLVILPFLIFEKQFEQLGTWLAEGHASGWASAAAIGALLALDVFLPVPSSIVSTGAGVLLGFWRGAAVIWIGMTMGCAIGYAFGARAAPAARRLVGADSLARASTVMERYGPWALVVCVRSGLAEASVVFGGSYGPVSHSRAHDALDLGIEILTLPSWPSDAGASFFADFLAALLYRAGAAGGKMWLGRAGYSGPTDIRFNRTR